MSTTSATTSQWQFPQDVRRTYRTAVRGKGIRIWDTEGREYIDADSGAISVISIGHGVTEVADAIAEQAARLAYVHDVQFQHEPAEELAAAIARFAPGSLNRTAFVSGGSEAVESAIKLARNHHVLRGHETKHVVLSRARSYHGATLFALSIGGVPHRQKPYLPYMASGHPEVVAPYCYRCPLGLAYPACDNACATDLERAILEIGAENVAAFIAEPIVAAAGPGITPQPGYYERIREVCDRHDIVMISDEVVTGWGRTGRNFGIDHWGVEPDVIVTAKGLAGGYVPLGAVIMSDAIAETFIGSGSSFVHDFTYGAHPVACAAGLAVLRIIERDRLVENAAVQGEYLFGRLRELADEPEPDRRHPRQGPARRDRARRRSRHRHAGAARTRAGPQGAPGSPGARLDDLSGRRHRRCRRRPDPGLTAADGRGRRHRRDRAAIGPRAKRRGEIVDRRRLTVLRAG